MADEEKKDVVPEGFRKLSEFTVEELLKLPRIPMRMVETTNDRTGQVRFNAYVYLLESRLEVRFPIDRATYHLVARLRGKDSTKSEYTVSFPYRVVRGRGVSEEDGHEFDYYYVEGYAAPMERKVYLNQLLTGSQVDLVECFGLDGVVDRGYAGSVKGVGYFDDLG